LRLDREGECLILGHIVVWGAFTEASTWEEVDEVLRTKWRHPFGGLLRVDACVIDAGDEGRPEAERQEARELRRRSNLDEVAIRRYSGGRVALEPIV
jgi:phage terminase large subunit GpA-like protein